MPTLDRATNSPKSPSATSRANTRTNSTTFWPDPRTYRRRVRCIRSSTAASTGTPASTPIGCWPACCAATHPAAGEPYSPVVRRGVHAGPRRYRTRLSRPADDRDVRTALWLGVAADVGCRARAAAGRGSTPLVGRHTAAGARILATLCQLPAKGDVSGPLRYAFQLCLRDHAGLEYRQDSR